jgi:hypothetical protein
MIHSRSRRHFGLALATLLATETSSAGWFSPEPAPAAARDYASQRLSDQGVYRVSYQVEDGAVAIRRLHNWRLHIERTDGSPVTDATVEVDGDMPEHRHGLPTRPRVTRHLGNGDYLVEGIKFQMGGWWVMDFTIASGARKDKVQFNLQLQK